MKKVLSLTATFFINTGLIGLVYLTFIKEPAKAPVQHVQIQTPAPSTPERKVISGTPVRAVFASVAVDVAIIEGIYDRATQKWTLSETKAHYATIMPKPNDDAGNSFIYGHNNRLVFSRLINLKAGDKAEIYTDNGYKFTYILKTIEDVTPQDVSLFEYRGEPILTVQTCSGSWYQDRRLFTFSFEGVVKL